MPAPRPIDMDGSVTFIGFGEAGLAFAKAGDRAFDVKTTQAATRTAKMADYAAAAIHGCATADEALAGVATILSVVTADQALPAARDYAASLAPGSFWFDMNSVAPGTKRAAAAAIEAAGGRYVDVAVMAPVLPARLHVPLLVSGPHAYEGVARLRDHGFANVEIAGPRLGDASAIKMIRSVMVKGIEALSAECALAADAAGVTEAVLASLDASWKSGAWSDRVDYNLDRMMAHGTRRAAEMEEVASTLTDLGVEPEMTRGTIKRQQAIGALGLCPPTGLAAKIAAITSERKDQAA